MAVSKPELSDRAYPLGIAARLTGISPEVLRAWERRYGAVRPLRTPGGTRRYSAEDLDRLRLLKAAVDAGHRIGQIANLERDELSRRLAVPDPSPSRLLDEVLGALDQLDDAAAHRVLSLQLATLGPAHFVRGVAIPLVHEIGERWVNGSIGIAAEHLATGILRSLLGAALQPTSTSLRGPRIIFATPSGERHELGLLMAALTALGAGANPLYLGTELPVADFASAAKDANAVALALSIVTIPTTQAESAITELRVGVPANIRLWLGGSGAGKLRLPPGVECLDSLKELEIQTELLGYASPHAG